MMPPDAGWTKPMKAKVEPTSGWVENTFLKSLISFVLGSTILRRSASDKNLKRARHSYE